MIFALTNKYLKVIDIRRPACYCLDMTATILDFPVAFTCPTCGRPCAEDELTSECLRCGQQFCGKDDGQCQCDRDAVEMLARAQR